MKIDIATNKIESQEFQLNLIKHFYYCIKNELYEKFNCYDKAYKFLLEKYDSILKSKNLEKYINYSIKENKTSEDNIFSLLCHMDRTLPYVLWSTINKIAKRDKKHYLSLFILLEHKINFGKDDPYKSLLYFGANDIPFVLEMLKDAYDNKLLRDYISLSNHLSKILQEVKMVKKDEKNESLDFLNKLEKSTSNKYIYFSGSDEKSNYFDIFNNNIELDYKEIITSENFIKYVKSDTFGIYDIEDFKGFVKCYLSYSNIDPISEISAKVINEKIENVLCTKDDIINLNIEEINLIDF